MPESRRIVVITGGSSGIGRAICLRFAREGAGIIFVHYDPDDLKANETLGLLEKMDVEARAKKLDVSSFVAVEEFFQAVIREFQRVDVLVNNAGIIRDAFLMRMSEDQWDQALMVNLKGVFNCTKAVVRSMIKERSGRIINISSVVGQIGNIGHPLGIATNLIGRLVPLAVPLVIISATESIIKALTQKGSIFDLTFRNTIDDRNNVLRSRESQQEIRVGFEGKSQLIVTTRAGSTSPILSYNTYEQRNNNTLEFEKMRAVREVGGT